jgi:hypothetical protein
MQVVCLQAVQKCKHFAVKHSTSVSTLPSILQCKHFAAKHTIRATLWSQALHYSSILQPSTPSVPLFKAKHFTNASTWQPSVWVQALWSWVFDQMHIQYRSCYIHVPVAQVLCMYLHKIHSYPYKYVFLTKLACPCITLYICLCRHIYRLCKQCKWGKCKYSI